MLKCKKKKKKKTVQHFDVIENGTWNITLIFKASYLFAYLESKSMFYTLMLGYPSQYLPTDNSCVWMFTNTINRPTVTGRRGGSRGEKQEVF